ncbi:beta strand repeat-containing protein [Chromatium okenii]|uniref:beta strand repeat-containing protein n=1 Tax=Chromatium okenii TaxID=61644 RepID=UPI001904C7CC|nr:hypothetical protein [Chromatium okenii]
MVRVQAGELRLDDAGIYSQATKDSTGNAGAVNLTVDGLLEVLNGAEIASSTFAIGDAGTVTVQAGQVRLNGAGLTDQLTGIASSAEASSTGNAGTVTLTVDGLLEVLNGAVIISSTFAIGDAGMVTVQAGELHLDSQGFTNWLTGIASGTESTGNGGAVNLSVDGLLEVLNGAQIISSTFAIGDAGMVTVQAGELHLDSQGFTNWLTGIASGTESTGNGGAVNLSVDGLLEVLNGAAISSNTFATGDAGTVTVHAGELLLDGGGLADQFTGIASSAEASSTGNAGAVNLTVAGLLDVFNGAEISSSTSATGDAGAVTVKAGELRLDDAGIYSQANEDSTGRVGNLNIAATTITLTDNAQISIAALQNIPDQTLSLDRRIQINAASLALNASTITAQSTGNVPAAAIQINAADLRLNAASRITTESLAANAGAITIDGDILWLRDSQITTSAEGQNGDGGDIVLTPRNLILQSGFIQANTAASGARGGDIRINSDTLIASQRLLAVGGNERQTFIAGDGRNIIQAAAPGGEQGNINILALNLDISASVVPPSAPFGDPDDLLADICRTVNGPLASSLIDRGNGGVPADPSAPVAVSLGGTRLDRILNHAPE